MFLLRFLLVFLFFIKIASLAAQPFYEHKIVQERVEFYLIGQTEPIISIPLDRPFLKAAYSTPTVKERYGFFKFKEQVEYRCQQTTVDTIIASRRRLRIEGQLCEQPFVLSIWAIDTRQAWVNITLPASDQRPYNRLYFTYAMAPDEAILGLGEQYTYNNLNGQRVPMWVEEQGIGAGDQPISAIANVQQAGGHPLNTYAPIPFYLSSKGYSLQLSHTCRSVFDLRQRQTATIEIWQDSLDLYLSQSQDPLDLVAAHTNAMGRQPQLPDWAWGTVVGLQGGREPVLRYVDSLEASGTAISAVWLQDWVGRRRTFVGDQLRWNWEVDEARYPNFRAFCAELDARGIAVLGYINPMLVSDGPLYAEAAAKGYLVKDHRDSTYVLGMTGFDVGLVDLTNPAACTWIKGLIQTNMIGAGLKGWMADFGEALPWDAVLHSGVSAEVYHNQYPVDWARINREAIEEAGKLGEVAFFARSAFRGSSRYATLFWAGDQMVSWQKNDGLRAVVPALTSSGISGMALNHADVGGYAGFWRAGGLFGMRRTKRLLMRHIELGAFSPIFRTHEGILPKRNAQVYSTPELRAFYAKFSQIHAVLTPYLKELNQAATQNGYPLVRHLYLHYPKDPESLKVPYQYLLGPAILVAPVYKKGANSVRVYLPKGQWKHWFTGKVYEGGRYYRVKAPLGQPAVFVDTNHPLAKR